MSRIKKRRRIGSGLPGSSTLAGPGPVVGPERPAGVSPSGFGRLGRAIRSSGSGKTSTGPQSVAKTKPQSKSKPTARGASRRKKDL